MANTYCNDLIDAVPSKERLAKGPVAVFECLQQIPCNPCAEACPRKAITVEHINDCPSLNEALCNGCGVCMSKCPGLSIFVIDYTYEQNRGLVKIPYEFFPLPKEHQTVDALNRSGECVGLAEVVRVQPSPNKTNIIWLAVPQAMIMEVRAIRLREEEHHG